PQPSRRHGAKRRYVIFPLRPAKQHYFRRRWQQLPVQHEGALGDVADGVTPAGVLREDGGLLRHVDVYGNDQERPQLLDDRQRIVKAHGPGAIRWHQDDVWPAQTLQLLRGQGMAQVAEMGDAQPTGTKDKHAVLDGALLRLNTTNVAGDV